MFFYNDYCYNDTIIYNVSNFLNKRSLVSIFVECRKEQNKDGNIVIMFRVNCAEPREKSSITLTVGCKIYFIYSAQFWFSLWCFIASFNNISDISWRSVLLVEECGESNRSVESQTNFII